MKNSEHPAARRAIIATELMACLRIIESPNETEARKKQAAEYRSLLLHEVAELKKKGG